MDLQEVMAQRSFAVLGDTVNSEKYAYKIKKGLLDNGYAVYCVGKELSSLNEITGKIDVIDLCINPVKGLELLRESKKACKCVVIQPGAESPEIKAFLDEKKIPYIEGCVLVGLSIYKNYKN